MCEETISVIPSALSWVNRRASEWRASGSSPEAGSSSINTPGAWINAWPIATRCRCPRESSAARRPSRSESPRRSAVFSTARERSARATPCAAAACARHCATLSASYRPKKSDRKPTLRCTARGSSSTSRPSTWIRPSIGRSRPARQRSRVVLPAPFGPTSAVTLPLPTSKLTSSSARTPGYSNMTWLAETAAGVDASAELDMARYATRSAGRTQA